MEMAHTPELVAAIRGMLATHEELVLPAPKEPAVEATPQAVTEETGERLARPVNKGKIRSKTKKA
jgi:hypothetical protein